MEYFDKNRKEKYIPLRPIKSFHLFNNNLKVSDSVNNRVDTSHQFSGEFYLDLMLIDLRLAKDLGQIYIFQNCNQI